MLNFQVVLLKLIKQINIWKSHSFFIFFFLFRSSFFSFQIWSIFLESHLSATRLTWISLLKRKYIDLQGTKIFRIFSNKHQKRQQFYFHRGNKKQEKKIKVYNIKKQGVKKKNIPLGGWKYFRFLYNDWKNKILPLIVILKIKVLECWRKISFDSRLNKIN